MAPNTIQRAKKLAKSLRARLPGPTPLHACQAAIAAGAGFADWHDLEQRIGSTSLGWDEDRAVRRLAIAGIASDVARQAIHDLAKLARPAAPAVHPVIRALCADEEEAQSIAWLSRAPADIIHRVLAETGFANHPYRVPARFLELDPAALPYDLLVAGPVFRTAEMFGRDMLAQLEAIAPLDKPENPAIAHIARQFFHNPARSPREIWEESALAC